MSYAVGNRQFPIRDFRRAVFDENPVGNACKFRPDFHRKSLVGNCLSLITPHNIVLLLFCCLIPHNIVLAVDTNEGR